MVTVCIQHWLCVKVSWGGGEKEGEREREEAEREKITNTTAICTVAHLLDKIVLTDSAY